MFIVDMKLANAECQMLASEQYLELAEDQFQQMIEEKYYAWFMGMVEACE
jgi:hypothetical protein